MSIAALPSEPDHRFPALLQQPLPGLPASLFVLAAKETLKSDPSLLCSKLQGLPCLWKKTQSPIKGPVMAFKALGDLATQFL